MKRRSQAVFLSAILLLCLCIALPVQADIFEPGLKIRAGGFLAQMSSSISATDPESGRGLTVDFESTLGLEDSKFSPYLEFTYRFNQKHAVLLNYLNLDRNTLKQGISQSFELNWGDENYVIDAGATLETVLDFQVYQAAYMYSFYTSDRSMVAGSLGFHITDLANEYQGTIGIRVDDDTVQYGDRIISESVTAPLPVVGIFAYHQLDHGLVLSGRAQYFQLEIDDTEGQLIDLRAEVFKYLDANKHWALGLGYQYNEITVDHQDDRTTLNAEITYHGPSFFLQYDF